MTTNQQIADAAQGLVGMPLPAQPDPLLYAVNKILATIYGSGLQLGQKIQRTERQAGNIVKLRFMDGQNPSMAYGILTKRGNQFYLVREHRGIVVEHILDKVWLNRITEFIQVKI